jgi:hypothetical protein
LNTLTVFDRLVNAYPFIYRTKTLGTKFIGFATFGKCTPIEEEKYEDYCSKLKLVSDFDNYEDSSEYNDLIDAFDSVVNCEPMYHNCESIGAISCRLADALAELDQAELTKVCSQYEDFVKVRSLSVKREIKKWTSSNEAENQS